MKKTGKDLILLLQVLILYTMFFQSWGANVYFEIKDIDKDIPLWLMGVIVLVIYIPGCILCSGAVEKLDERVLKVIHLLPLDKEDLDCYLSRYFYGYWVISLSLVSLFGVAINLAFMVLLILLFFLVQGGILFYSCKEKARKEKHFFSSLEYIGLIFLLSGFAALIYQIVWQRHLFLMFGVDVESVTVIVSIFMLGLGIGALFGGILSKVFSKHLITLFVIFEILIGFFGFFSLQIMTYLIPTVPRSSLVDLVLYTYLVLGLPTLLMGATLPILVTYLHQRIQHIGSVVSWLYFFNTIGSALASFLTVTLILVLLGKQSAVFIASAFNIFTAWLIYRYSCTKKTMDKAPLDASDSDTSTHQSLKHYQPSMSLIATCLLSFLVGFITLSQEIIWFRAFNLIDGSAPQTFGYVLSAFLTGIAFGSLRAKRACIDDQCLYLYMAKVLLISGLIFFLSFPLRGWLKYMASETPIGTLLGYVLVGLTAYFAGGIFPILSHLAIDPKSKSVGSRLSLIYFANIVGATGGPLLTGFVLLDYLSIRDNIMVFSVMSLIAVMIIFFGNSVKFEWNRDRILKGAAGVVFVVIYGLLIYPGIIGRLHHTHISSEYLPFAHVVENRSGIITVEKHYAGDVIYGSGVYDGMINIDPVINSNEIRRTYALTMLHPSPKTVLNIGLSGGSWSRVVSLHQELEQMDIVEINKGYIKVIEQYDEISPILTDPRITIHVDDGRRWLRQNPDRKYDVILMNTSLYWRNQSTNILSTEFLTIVKNHLKPGGVVYYNSTGLEDIWFTAANVFQYVTRVKNFVAASDSPFNQTAQEREANLMEYVKSDGTPIFDPTNEELLALRQEMVEYEFEPLHELLADRRDLWVVTDDNMATEYKIDQHFYQPHLKWTNLLK